MVSEHAHLCAGKERWPRTSRFRKTTAKAHRTQMLKEKEAVTHQGTHFQDQARLDLCCCCSNNGLIVPDALWIVGEGLCWQTF